MVGVLKSRVALSGEITPDFLEARGHLREADSFI